MFWLSIKFGKGIKKPKTESFTRPVWPIKRPYILMRPVCRLTSFWEMPTTRTADQRRRWANAEVLLEVKEWLTFAQRPDIVPKARPVPMPAPPIIPQTETLNDDGITDKRPKRIARPAAQGFKH